MMQTDKWSFFSYATYSKIFYSFMVFYSCYSNYWHSLLPHRTMKTIHYSLFEKYNKTWWISMWTYMCSVWVFSAGDLASAMDFQRFDAGVKTVQWKINIKSSMEWHQQWKTCLFCCALPLARSTWETSFGQTRCADRKHSAWYDFLWWPGKKQKTTRCKSIYKMLSKMDGPVNKTTHLHFLCRCGCINLLGSCLCQFNWNKRPIWRCENWLYWVSATGFQKIELKAFILEKPI